VWSHATVDIPRRRDVMRWLWVTVIGVLVLTLGTVTAPRSSPSACLR